MLAQRIDAVRRLMKERKLDGLLISHYYNIFYLTGCKTLTDDEHEAFVLVTPQTLYLFTDPRYSFSVPGVEVRFFKPGKGLSFYLNEISGVEGVKRIGFESEYLSYFEYDAVQRRLNKISFVPQPFLMILVREVKDKDEIAAVKKACASGDHILKEIVPLIAEGMSERDIAFKIEMAIKQKGWGLAFDPIVAIDKNSAIPHYDIRTGGGTVKKGSIILVDFGVRRDDYLSDITRMFFYGKPSDEMMNVYDRLLTAQQASVNHVAKVDLLSEVDAYCRALLTKDGLPLYPHSTGHGVGLEIHEYPKVTVGAPDRKKDSQIITIEPGVYYEGKYGMRIEDTVVIHKGKAVPLTLYPKKPALLGR